MCGIAGAIDWKRPPDVAAVSHMTRRLARRGPDAEKIVHRGAAALGHRRLAVIAPTPEGVQPMADAGGQYWIVFNGEIYNYRELRAELTASGTTFATATDTEVMLEAYKRWDVECLSRFNGMFAFALWDEPRQRLLLARDRVGEKPLYYKWLAGGGLAFASGLKALRLHPGVGGEIDPVALGQFLSLNYVLGDRAMLRDVQKLPPAHFLVATDAGPTAPACYWDLARHFREKRRFESEPAAADELSALFDDAVRMRLVSDVPLGAFLSGGVDSGAVVGAMARLGPAASNRTFTLGFAQDSYDETPDARQTAAFFGAQHSECRINVDIARALPEIVAEVDEPFADTSIIPMYFLSRFAREHVTVCLSGDGSDEIFAGYPTYAADRLRHLTAWVPPRLTRYAAALADAAWPVTFDKVSLDYKVKRFLRGHALPQSRAHYFWRTILDDGEKAALVRAERREAVCGPDPFAVFDMHARAVEGCHYLDQAAYVDIKTWLVDDILVKMDQATMAHGLEARPPFLDHRLVEFAASLPPGWKMKGMRQKHLLKLSQAARLPAEVLRRRKQGFGAPVSDWLSGPLEPVARAAMNNAVMREWFDPAALERLWSDHHARRRDYGMALFGLTCLGLWCESHS
jgi:asparagine synthase (glutamine-hydrolysing)